MRISTDYYRKLYTIENVDVKTQDILLRNIKSKLTKEAKMNLEKPFIEEDVKNTIDNLPTGKVLN